MFRETTLEEVIKESGVLEARPPSASGWHEVKCAVCGDYKRRGGFLFDGTGSVVYKCFNCGQKAGFTTGSTSFSAGMQRVLDSFQIDSRRTGEVLFTGFARGGNKKREHLPRDLRPASVTEKPASFFPLDSARHNTYVEYLATRGFTPTDFQDLWVPLSVDRVWKNRLIIPVFNHRDQLVFYQGRSIVPTRKRWESPPLPKTGVIFDHNKLYDRSRTDLIVCEGMFDAKSVDGVAILGSEFSAYHLSELQKFKGRKLVVPNKDSNGVMMGRQALENGLALSFPDIGSCSDLNEAKLKYGGLYLEQQIYNSIVVGPEAEMKLRLWCTS